MKIKRNTKIDNILTEIESMVHGIKVEKCKDEIVEITFEEFLILTKKEYHIFYIDSKLNTVMGIAKDKDNKVSNILIIYNKDNRVDKILQISNNIMFRFLERSNYYEDKENIKTEGEKQ